MIKVMVMIKRKPGISHEEFCKHYEEVHVPLALKLLPTIKKYVRNHVVTFPGTEELGFDCITEFWYDDMEGVQASLDTLNSDAGQVIHNDEATFMDKDKQVVLLVDERETK